MSQLVGDRARIVFDPRTLTPPRPQPHHSRRYRGWQARGHLHPPSMWLCPLFTAPSLALYPAGGSHHESVEMACPYLCLARLQTSRTVPGPSPGSKPSAGAHVIFAAEGKEAERPRNSQPPDNTTEPIASMEGKYTSLLAWKYVLAYCSV